jgi:hypothetical protein
MKSHKIHHVEEMGWKQQEKTNKPQRQNKHEKKEKFHFK